MDHYNPDRLWRGRSWKKNNPEVNFRSGVKTRANSTIRDHRDRSAREADRRCGEDDRRCEEV